MRAITVIPGQPESVQLSEVAEPTSTKADVLVETVAIGICGTDIEIVHGDYGEAPPGEDRLIIGHESIGRVMRGGHGYDEGEWVVGIVRRPDPVPCANCAAGEWDMCSNGRYVERGIKGLHGYASERYAISPGFLIRVPAKLAHVGVLLEPTSIVAKAWEHIERIGERSRWRPRNVLITGAGPIGLLAALIGVQRGLEVHVLDRAVDGPKPDIVRALGASYHTGSVKDAVDGADVVLECTGASALWFDVIEIANPDGIVCLTGVSHGGQPVRIDPGVLNREIVLENNVVFGSVNANRRHYEAAATILDNADPDWLSTLITRQVPLENWKGAFEKKEGDIKTVLSFVN